MGFLLKLFVILCCYCLVIGIICFIIRLCYILFFKKLVQELNLQGKKQTPTTVEQIPVVHKSSFEMQSTS